MTKEELLDKLGLKEADQETQDVILKDISTTVSTRITSLLTERLSDEDLAALDKLMDEGNEGGVEWYLKSKFEHYDNFAQEIEQQVIDEIIQNQAALRASYNNEQGPASLLNL